VEKKMIPLFKVFMSEDAIRLSSETMRSGYIGQGPQVDEFEHLLKSFIGLGRAPYATTSGTHALDLAYHLCGIGHGSEVICTPQTCAATATQLLVRGAKIVWADVNPESGLISPEDVSKKVTKKTVAIVAVDWGGQLCDYASLRKNLCPVIQDAAHSFGALGVHGDYVAWSFQAIKHLTTGDGGALLVPEDEEDRADLLRWYGLNRRVSLSFRCSQDIPEAGYKYGMNDIAASIGIGNLRHIADVLSKHRSNAQFFSTHIKNQHVIAPKFNELSSWWLYTVLVNDQKQFIGHMKSNGVDAGLVHSRIDEKSCFRDSNVGGLPGVDAFSSREVCIPVGWWLTESDRDQIVSAVNSWALK
jgi:dTDP-4-amino-4,6-dideoxygalactose transaminase